MKSPWRVVANFRHNSNERRHTQACGYTYFEVTDNAAISSSRMAVPEGTPPVRKFAAGSPLLVSHNSRLPVIVFVPTGYEVRYRIWQANEIIRKAVQG